jgi:hypothetical protein
MTLRPGTELRGTTTQHPGTIKIGGTTRSKYRIRFGGGQHNSKEEKFLEKTVVESFYIVTKRPKN